MASKPVYAVLHDFAQQGIGAVRLDTLASLCESGQAAVDAQVKHLLKRGEALVAGGRIYLATQAAPDDEPLPDFLPPERQCKDCGKVQPASAFRNQTATSRNTCRSCRTKQMREWRERKAVYTCRLCHCDFEQGDGLLVSCCPKCRKLYPANAAKLKPTKKGANNVRLERPATADERNATCEHCGRGDMPRHARSRGV